MILEQASPDKAVPHRCAMIGDGNVTGAPQCDAIFSGAALGESATEFSVCARDRRGIKPMLR